VTGCRPHLLAQPLLEDVDLLVQRQARHETLGLMAALRPRAKTPRPTQQVNCKQGARSLVQSPRLRGAATDSLTRTRTPLTDLSRASQGSRLGARPCLPRVCALHGAAPVARRHGDVRGPGDPTNPRGASPRTRNRSCRCPGRVVRRLRQCTHHGARIPRAARRANDGVCIEQRAPRPTTRERVSTRDVRGGSPTAGLDWFKPRCWPCGPAGSLARVSSSADRI
jgi:hypothetical protein